MKILVADDDRIPRLILERALSSWGYDVVTVSDGRQALEVLAADHPPPLAILDWVMPGLTGIEVCRQARATAATAPYVIMVTGKRETADVVAVLEAGADDFVSKPFVPEELRARVQVGARIVSLQHRLAERVRSLEASLQHVKQLQGLLPICAYCKRVRNDQSYWQQIEVYIAARSEATFSHGICPDCRGGVVEEQLRKYREKHKC